MIKSAFASLKPLINQVEGADNKQKREERNKMD
jgi:hypothetical protein